MVESSYTVTGTTCQHCVSSVTEEITAIDGVTGVDVDLPKGSVTITSDKPIDEFAVHAAVREAGFEFADAG
ncbi:MAG: heavy-metal-associated domain-containing protein [Actinomycetota bacterium]|nr:heavy-metal-associated domain-containing protein [Actinomycetota bacterium]